MFKPKKSLRLHEKFPETKFINQSLRKLMRWVGEKPTGIFKFGEYVALNDAVVDFTGGVHIGDRVHFGREVMVLSCSHPTHSVDGIERRKTLSCAPIVIEDDVYIGSRAIILEGVTLGKGSYIAAGAVVQSDVASGILVGGVPARFIREV